MVYMGSKNRIAKYIVPIIESYKTSEDMVYIEPFVGGANVIDKVDFKTRIGYDSNEYLIALLNYIKDVDNPLPERISEEMYYKVRDNKSNFEKWSVGLVGFCASYGGRFFEGYARDKDGKRNIPTERINNIQKQRKKIANVQFEHIESYEDLADISNTLIYCDPPYKGTKKYKNSINYEEYYNWVRKMSKNNIVICSEYEMPDDFECIWEKEIPCTICKDADKRNTKQEKLFILKK